MSVPVDPVEIGQPDTEQKPDRSDRSDKRLLLPLHNLTAPTLPPIDIWATQPVPQWTKELSNGGKVVVVDTSRWPVRRLFFTYMDDPNASFSSLLYSVIVFGAILVSTITFLISNSVQYWDVETPWLDYIEATVICIFTYDYILRFVFVSGGCRGDKTKGGIKSYCFFKIPKINYYSGKLWFALSPFGLIDFFAIIPFYLDLIITAATNQSGVSALLVLRLLRLFRIFRLFKLIKFGSTIPAAIRAVSNAKVMLLTAFLTFLGAVIFFAAAVFYAEQTHESFDPLALAWFYDPGFGGGESPFQSVYHAMWYAVITITTVGYGDTFPITPAGKVAGSALMFCGVVMLALPLTLLSSALTNEISDMERAKLDDNIVRMIEAHQRADKQKPIGKGSLLKNYRDAPTLWGNDSSHYRTSKRELLNLHTHASDQASAAQVVLIKSHLLALSLVSWVRFKNLTHASRKVYVPRFEGAESSEETTSSSGSSSSSASSSSSSSSASDSS